MEKLNLDCVILAAGLSSRMGQWKMGLKYKNTTILQQSVATALKVCRNVIVVTGHNAALSQELLKIFPRVRIVHNAGYKNGQFSSAKAGIRSVQSPAFFITLGDLPLLTSSIYYLTYQHYLKTSGSVIFPCFNGKHGHPVLIDSSLIPQILTRPDSTSMKKTLFMFNPEYVEVHDASVVSDIDTPEEYRNILV